MKYFRIHTAENAYTRKENLFETENKSNGNEENLVWPDYKNCIANLPNSILKYYGVKTAGETLPLADRYLDKEYKNIVVILLDGMGTKIIEKHLKEDGAFRSNLAGTYNSVFLSTTVAATTSMMSGLQPCEHAWLGWDNYYASIDKNVTVFLNIIQGTDEQAAPYNVARTETPYENIFEKIAKSGQNAYCIAPFLDPDIDSIDVICSRIRELAAKDEKKFIYAYWDEPDGVLHKNGLSSDRVNETLIHLEEEVSKLADELEDTLIIVTADHGHIDTDTVFIWDYPKIEECLVRLPSLEPRVLNFFIKDGMKEIFEKEFNKEFGDKFILMPTEEAIEKNLFGTGRHHEKFRSMLGDYLAIATGNLSILVLEEEWKSLHGSITEEEMLIPLIVFE